MTPSTTSFPFPAKVVTPQGDELRLARIGVATTGPGGQPEMRVFVSVKQSVELFAAVLIESFHQTVNPLRPSSPTYTVVDDLDGTWTITRGAGCGCSDPLKRFNPDRWEP